MFSAWKAEENQVEGTQGGDAGGHDDDVDLDAVVDEVSWWIGGVRDWEVRCHAVKCKILPIPDEKRDRVPFRRVSEQVRP